MTKTPKEIKRDILSKFRSYLDIHETIPAKLQMKDYFQMLTSQEKSNFNQAVSDLIDNGLIVIENYRIPSLGLTNRGADLIY
ncbi:MAG: hypothetical protein AB7S77_13530 [Desulfatirhabdiaceae bacterium]